MPYKVVKQGNEWCVVNTDTGKSKGCSDSREKAISHMRLLYGVKQGWKPTGKPSKA